MANGDIKAAVAWNEGASELDTIVIPLGLTPAAGDIVVVFGWVQGGAQTLTLPGFAQLSDSNSISGEHWPRVYSWAKLAGGAESASVSIGVSNEYENRGGIAYVIEGSFDGLSGVVGYPASGDDATAMNVPASGQSVGSAAWALVAAVTYDGAAISWSNDFGSNLSSAYGLYSARRFYAGSSSGVQSQASWSGSEDAAGAMVTVAVSGAPDPTTLSSPIPSGTLETQTTATIGATTDQNTGTLYVVVDSAANISGITAAQIKAGNNNANSSAVAANSGAISTTSPSLGVTGLTAGTLYSYAVVQTNDNGDSNVVTGTFTTAEAAAQEATGTGSFGVAIAVTQAGTGQSAVRKLRLTEATDQELRSEIGVLLNISGVSFEWYDKFGNTAGDPDITGTIDIVNGEAVIPLFGSSLSASQPGTLILYHPSLNTANGLYRLLVE